MLNNIDLAARFIFVAERFLHIYKTQRTALRFPAIRVETNPICGTVACHGGFALIALRPSLVGATGVGFVHGATALAECLGFETAGELGRWAQDNPDVWGGPNGLNMFSACGYQAFGRNSPEGMTLADITQWYLNIVERLLNAKNK